MTGSKEPKGKTEGFRVGDRVQVKSKEEILATLDEQGELDSLPFMPEMLEYCGQEIPVYRRADKTCDPASLSGMYRMHGTVHLQDSRCDGSAHGGCQAACLLYWKEEWLRPAGDASSSAQADTSPAEHTTGISEAELAETTRTPTELDGAPEGMRYKCQATEMLRAAPELISKWDVGSLARDVRSGNAGLFQVLRSILLTLFNLLQRANRKFLPRLPLIHGAQHYPFLAGRLRKTPRRTLDLQPGELVRVKSREEIEATLDTKNRNRGLVFDSGMLRYCGREARVMRRVERIIDEKTGQMRHLPSDCIILEDVFCRGEYYKNCPRSIYSYWREIWLERVEPAVTSVPAAISKADVGVD